MPGMTMSVAGTSQGGARSSRVSARSPLSAKATPVQRSPRALEHAEHLRRIVDDQDFAHHPSPGRVVHHRYWSLAGKT